MENKAFLDYLGLTTFLSKLKTMFATKGEVSSTQSDWNITDKSSSAYIKNKPPSTIYSKLEPTTQTNNDTWIQEY